MPVLVHWGASVWPLERGYQRLRSYDQSCRHSLPMWLTSNAKQGYQGLGELPWLATLCMCCHTLLLGELSTVHVSPLGEDNQSLAPFLSWTLPMHLFPYWFNLFPFSVINQNHEYNSIAVSVSPFSKSSKLKVVVGSFTKGS